MDDSRRRHTDRPAARAGFRRSIRRRPAASATEGVTLTTSGLQVGSQALPHYAGALHYFRIEPAHWRPALEAMVDIGLGIVETCVPWSMHEVAPGRYDFGGTDPHKNLTGFLELVHELGMLAWLRVGPYVNAELTYLGLPERIVHDPNCQARSPHGGPVYCFAPPRMFPFPSHGSRQFLAETDGWYGALAELLRPQCWPHGPLVLLQIDGDPAPYARDAPYEQDYHPDVTAGFRGFLRGRHGSLAKLRASYGRPIQRWAMVDCPDRFTAETSDELPPHLDWIDYQEYVTCNAVHLWSERLRSGGLANIPIAHAMPSGEEVGAVSSTALAEVVDCLGVRDPGRHRDLHNTRRRALRAVGAQALPFAAHLQVGTPAWYAPLDPDSSVRSALCALGNGLRGFNLSMAVDRDRWVGAPISEDGSPRAAARTWRRLVEALRKNDFHRLQRSFEVGLLLPREYARLSRVTYALSGMGPSLLAATFGHPSRACFQTRLGFEHVIQQSWWRMLEDCARALDSAQVAYAYFEDEADLHRLGDPKLIISPTFETIEPRRWQLLQRCAQDGATVIVGPCVPSLDMTMRKFDFAPAPGMRTIQTCDPDAIERFVAGLVTELDLARPFAARPSSVWTAAYGRPEDDDRATPRVLFVGHSRPHPVETRIALPHPCRALDVLSGEWFEGDSELTVRLEPAECRMLQIHASGTQGAVEDAAC